MVEEPTTEEVIKNVVELLGIMSKNIVNSIKADEQIVTILENLLTVQQIHEDRIKQLAQGSGHTHWWHLL